MQFTPFDPICWLIFASFLVCMFLVVKLYHRRHPGYPESVEKEKKPTYEVAAREHKKSEVSVQIS